MEMANSTTALPDDVVREILLRLDGGDVALLFRCATACKRWRCLVAEPSFLLRRRWPRSLVGFFTQRCRYTRLPGTSPTGSNSQLAFASLPGPSLLGTGRHPVSSFVRADDADAVSVVDRAMPLATRGGLLLVRLYPGDDDLEPNVVRLAVCNPLAHTWEVLPELDCHSKFAYSDSYGHDILPSVSSNGRLAFRVVLIGADKDKSQFNLHAFVSGEASWRASVKCFNMMERQIWSMEHTEAVVCQGYAHWLFLSNSSYFHVLNVDVETWQVSLTKILSPTKEVHDPPNMVDFMVGFDIHEFSKAWKDYRRALRAFSAHHLTTTEGGTLLSLCVCRGNQLEIWTRKEDDGDQSGDGDAEWIRTRVIGHKLTALINQLDQPSCFWSGERTDTLLITDYRGRRIYNADLDNGTLEDVTHQFRGHAHGRIMPMEIDWPTFLTSRLGGL